MAWSDEQLNRIYDRTSGYCHLCGKKLAFTNYGCPGSRGAWEVEHSVPRASGGTDRANNLYAACIPCNRGKQTRSTRSCRGANGRTRAPRSRTARAQAKRENAVGGACCGALLGAVFGPLSAIGGAVLGAHLGHRSNPDEPR